jgi:hypothetical protein
MTGCLHLSDSSVVIADGGTRAHVGKKSGVKPPHSKVPPLRRDEKIRGHSCRFVVNPICGIASSEGVERLLISLKEKDKKSVRKGAHLKAHGAARLYVHPE